MGRTHTQVPSFLLHSCPQVSLSLGHTCPWVPSHPWVSSTGPLDPGPPSPLCHTFPVCPLTHPQCVPSPLGALCQLSSVVVVTPEPWSPSFLGPHHFLAPIISWFPSLWSSPPWILLFLAHSHPWDPSFPGSPTQGCPPPPGGARGASWPLVVSLLALSVFPTRDADP